MRDKYIIKCKDNSYRIVLSDSVERLDKSNVKTIYNANNKAVWKDSNGTYKTPFDIKLLVEGDKELKGKVNLPKESIKQGITGTARKTAKDKWEAMFTNAEQGVEIVVKCFPSENSSGDRVYDYSIKYAANKKEFPCDNEWVLVSYLKKLLKGQKIDFGGLR